MPTSLRCAPYAPPSLVAKLLSPGAAALRSAHGATA